MRLSSETQIATIESNTRHSPSFLEALGSNVKALVPKTKRTIPFSILGRNNYGIGNADFGSGGYGTPWGNSSPGSTYDYRSAAGELLENSVVATCVDTVGQALADAPPILEKLVGTEWETIESHPITDLLNRPNPYHNPFEIWSAVAGSEMTTGEAFWRLEWNAARTQPTEIWYERPDSMRVIGTDDEYIAKYIFRRDDGAQFELDNSDVIHFRYALNPWNARRGASPIQSGLRQIAGDNSAATFHGALLRNCAVMSLLVSVKEGTGDNTTPDQLQEFTAALSKKLKGDNAGAIAGVNLPLDVTKMGYSPDEMALDKLINYYETRICALLRVDPMVVALGSGTTQKTYANMTEALNDFWERRIIPTKKRHSAVLGAQLLPLFGLDVSQYRISWDYRNVAPLQENEDAKHMRYREDYKAKIIDLYDAQIGLGMNPDESFRGVFFGSGAPTDPNAEPGAAQPQNTETKSMKDKDKEIEITPEGFDLAEWTDEELDAMTADMDSEEVIKDALALSTKEKRALNSAKPVTKNNG